jgi:hypothetical protein
MTFCKYKSFYYKENSVKKSSENVCICSLALLAIVPNWKCHWNYIFEGLCLFFKFTIENNFSLCLPAMSQLKRIVSSPLLLL